ncbi:MAG: hypothetical protein ABWK05_09140 [Pyrobaculum sp.]
MNFFSNLRLAMLGLLIILLLAPGAGMSFFKRLVLPAVGLGLLVAIALKRDESRR